jgi:hypothetical protein
MAAKRPNTPEAEFLVIAVVEAVIPIIEAKCGQLPKRDRNTLKRQVDKAVRTFIAGTEKRKRIAKEPSPN